MGIDPWLDIRIGDNRAVLDTLPEQSVHCVVTSPPYWGLRDYGTATWDGGSEDCDHRVGRVMGNANKGAVRDVLDGDRTVCKCGATRVDAQLGLEATPEEYVANMVDVFRKVRRVLRDDGTLWLNLGDSYGNPSAGRNDGDHRADGRSGGMSFKAVGTTKHTANTIKPKDLVGIPWRVAFALQADGWYLRSDIIWAKPNPMPESVTDRPTKSHEYMFLLSKSARYYWDQEAVREAHISSGPRRDNGSGDRFVDLGMYGGRAGNHPAGRNIRTVWTIPTKPYPGAHFAVFPPELVEPCIKAGCPEGGTVLDPFAGSGTVGMVAQKLSRRALLIDLNPEYLEQIEKRTAQSPLGL